MQDILLCNVSSIAMVNPSVCPPSVCHKRALCKNEDSYKNNLRLVGKFVSRGVVEGEREGTTFPQIFLRVNDVPLNRNGRNS